MKTNTILQIACLPEEADRQKKIKESKKTGLEVGLQRGWGWNKEKKAKIRKKIVTFAVDKYTTYLLVSGVGVVKHLHLFLYPDAYK